MQAANQVNHNEPQRAGTQEPNIVRVCGRLLGRIAATIGAVVAVRKYRASHNPPQPNLPPPNQTAAPNQLATNTWQQLWLQVREDAILAFTAIFTWNMQIGGQTGADVCEYTVDRVSHFVTQDVPGLPRSAVTVADRVTDNLLWRFANYASDKVPNGVKEAFQPPPAARNEGFRLF